MTELTDKRNSVESAAFLQHVAVARCVQARSGRAQYSSSNWRADMKLVPGSERMFADERTDPTDGSVRWAPAKSLWLASMTLAAIGLGPLLFSWQAFLLFITSSAVTLCFGHSVGMHRRLIHSSFECSLWLEHLCVYLGTLVGMAGPLGMVRIHDFRDWAQRQAACHDYSCHRAVLARRMVA